ncbi:MAG: hypothetical protein EOO09_11430 [Chitinophagaceae bacterium]|nr:MAG: hypothetical protein EOO09_11430 [Chitinophagaceae bacterium]
MKRFCLLPALLIASVMSVKAQNTDSDFKPFKVDLSLGYAIPGGSGAKSGVLFAIEPKYAVNEIVTLGLRMEAAVVARGYSGWDDSDGEVDVKASGSYVLTGDHYFSSNYSFRPFAGVGAGIYTIAAASVSDGGDAVAGEASSKFGGLFRAGFEAGHFRVGAEYNLVPSSKLQDINGGGTITSKNGYIGIKLGVCIGGGPR